MHDDYSINNSWKPILWGLPQTHRLIIYVPDEHKYSIYYSGINSNMKNTTKKNKEIK